MEEEWKVERDNQIDDTCWKEFLYSSVFYCGGFQLSDLRFLKLSTIVIAKSNDFLDLTLSLYDRLAHLESHGFCYLLSPAFHNLSHLLDHRLSLRKCFLAVDLISYGCSLNFDLELLVTHELIGSFEFACVWIFRLYFLIA